MEDDSEAEAIATRRTAPELATPKVVPAADAARGLRMGLILAMVIGTLGITTRVSPSASLATALRDDREVLAEDRVGAPDWMVPESRRLHAATGMLSGPSQETVVALITAPIHFLVEKGQTFNGLAPDDDLPWWMASLDEECHPPETDHRLLQVFHRVLLIAPASELEELGEPLTLHAAGATGRARLRDISADEALAFLVADLDVEHPDSCHFEDHVPQGTWQWIRPAPASMRTLSRAGGAGTGTWSGFDVIALAPKDGAQVASLSPSGRGAVVAFRDATKTGIGGFLLQEGGRMRLHDPETVVRAMRPVLAALADVSDDNIFGVELATASTDRREPRCVVRRVVPGSRAEATGVRSGDSFVSIARESPATWSECKLLLGRADLGELLVVERDGHRRSLAVTERSR